MIQAFRPDRLTAMARVFVEKVLGSGFAHVADKELDLATSVENEVSESEMLRGNFTCRPWKVFTVNLWMT